MRCGMAENRLERDLVSLRDQALGDAARDGQIDRRPLGVIAALAASGARPLRCHQQRLDGEARELATPPAGATHPCDSAIGPSATSVQTMRSIGGLDRL